MIRWGMAAMLLAGTARADIHAAVSIDGRLLIADRPVPGSMPFLPLAAPDHEAPRGAVMRMPYPSPSPELRGLFSIVARESGVDARLLEAVAARESAYNPHARSRAGAIGLMQLMPDTARRFRVRDPHDPAQNLRGAAAYLAWLLGRFDQDLTLALAAYNAGEGAVARYGNRIPPFPETRAYVQAVLAAYGSRPPGPDAGLPVRDR